MNESIKVGEITLSGKSMYPAFKEGDTLKVHFYDQPQFLQDQKEGQVVLAREDGAWVAHRIVSYKNKKYFKGDWSETYSFQEDAFIWGEVVEVAGKKEFCESYSLAKISSLDLILPFRTLRRIRKALLFFYIKTIRQLRAL